MANRIAVLIRDRQEEGLRMAVGLTLKDDKVDVYVLDRGLEASENNSLNLETLELLESEVFTNVEGDDGLTFIPTEDLAEKLTGYNSVLPY